MKVRATKIEAGHFVALTLRSALILLALAVEAAVAQTQDSLPHSISLRSGYFYLVNRDDLASPMKYSGGSLPLELSYDYRGDVHKHSVQISYRTGALKSAISSYGIHRGDEHGATIAYDYFHKITIVDERTVRTFIGGTWENSVDFTIYQYSAGTSSPGLLAYSCLSLSGLAEYRWSARSLFNARLSVPLVAYALRPDWAFTSPVPNETILDLLPFEDHLVHLILKGGRTVSWKSFRGFGFRMGYDFALTPSWGFSARYAFQNIYYSWPLPVRSVVGQVDVGLSTRF